MPNREEWEKSWEQFLETVHGLVNGTDPRKTGFPVETGNEPLGVGEITGRIVNDLTEKKALTAVTEAFNELDSRVQDYLLAELQLFNAATSAETDAGTLYNKPVTEQLVKSTTVKDSVKSILTLPGWIDHALEILDELLDLVT